MSRLASAALILVTGFGTARAEHPRKPLDFAQAVGLVADLPPLTARREATVREQRSAIPRPWSAFAIRVSPSLRMFPEDSRGLEGTLAIEQALPLADLREVKRAARDAAAAQYEADAAAAQLEAHIDVAASWIAAWAARERVAATQLDRELAQAMVAFSERAERAGALTAPEVADARAFLAEAELVHLEAEGSLDDAGFATAKALGIGTSVAATGELPAVALPEPAAWHDLVAAVKRSPEATARQVAARAAKARAAEEAAQRGTQLLLGGSIGRDGPGALVGFVTVGVALPFDRGEREVQAAESAAHIAIADAAQLTARAAAELALVFHEVDHSGRVLAEIEGRLVPTTTEAATRRQRAFELGEATMLEVLSAQRAANAARRRLTDARATHAWARVHAWLLLEATGAQEGS